jgi:hypothetical protein
MSNTTLSIPQSASPRRRRRGWNADTRAHLLACNDLTHAPRLVQDVFLHEAWNFMYGDHKPFSATDEDMSKHLTDINEDYHVVCERVEAARHIVEQRGYVA